jgi:hypothetical protein
VRSRSLAGCARLLRNVGLPTSLGHWQPWALISLGLAGLLLSQSAYQAGALSVSLPIIDTLEPISGVVIGTAIFGEHLAASPAALALQLAGAVIAVAGIALLDPASMAPGDRSDGSGSRHRHEHGALDR